MIRRMAWLLLLFLPLCATPAEGQFFPTQPDSGLIAVTGIGEVRVAPGRAIIYATFSGEDADGAVAVSAAAAARDRAVAALREAGLAPEAVTPSGAGFGDLAVQGPRRPPAPGEPQVREALLGLRIEVAPVSRLEAVLAALAEAGVENLRHVRMEPVDAASARQQAARLAMSDARAEAEALAATAGVRLGRLVSLATMPDMSGFANSGWMQYGGPFEQYARMIPNEVTVRIIVQARWELVR